MFRSQTEQEHHSKNLGTVQQEPYGRKLYCCKKILMELSSRNRFLSAEIGKIPELQKGITPKDVAALKEICRLYHNHHDRFDRIYIQMHLVGNPGKRRYNTPLQAFYWLVKDGYLIEAENLIKDYSLTSLLRYAWLLEHTRHLNRWRWRVKAAKKLYDSCQDQGLKNRIDRFYQENRGAVDLIISLAEKHPNDFGFQFVPFTGEIKRNEKRWDNFKKVAERINAPELVHYYIQSNFYYEPDKYASPEEIFRTGSGNSAAMSEWGVFLLKKAGYKTFVRKLKGLQSPCVSEHTGSGIITDQGDYILVVDFPKGKKISGPHNLQSLDRELSQGHCMYPTKRKFPIPKPNIQRPPLKSI